MASKTNHISDYRNLVDTIFKGIKDLCEQESELQLQRQRKRASHSLYPAFEKLMKVRPIVDMTDPEWVVPPRRQPPKELQDWFDDVEKQMAEPDSKYQKECAKLVALIKQAKTLRKAVGDQFLHLKVDEFYSFASMLHAKVLDEAAIKSLSEGSTEKVTSTDLDALKEKWNALASSFDQIEDSLIVGSVPAKKGRPTKEESDALKVSIAMWLKKQPGLEEDIETLAGKVGVHPATVRRHLKKINSDYIHSVRREMKKQNNETDS